MYIDLFPKFFLILNINFRIVDTFYHKIIEIEAIYTEFYMVNYALTLVKKIHYYVAKTWLKQIRQDQRTINWAKIKSDRYFDFINFRYIIHKTAVTENILNCYSSRQFWISWRDNQFRFGIGWYSSHNVHVIEWKHRSID